MLDSLAKARTTSLSMEEWKKLQNRDKLSDYLPYHTFDNIKKIYHNNNGTFGSVFKIHPRQIAGKTTSESFEEILNKMFENNILQVIVVGSKNDLGVIEKWRKAHLSRVDNGTVGSADVSNLIQIAVENIAEFYYQKFTEPITNQMSTYLKDFRIYFSITSEDLDEAVMFHKILKDVLEGNQFHPEIVEPRELQMLIYEILNSSHSLEEEATPSYDDNKEINRQVIALDTEIEFTDYYTLADGKYWINSSPARYPEYAALSDMGMKIGDYISSAMNTNQFRENFIISLSCKKQGNKQIKKVKQSHSVIITQKWSELLFRKFNDVRKESVSILDRIDVKKESLFAVDMNVLISGKTLKDAEQNTSIITSYWNKGGRSSSIVLNPTKGIQQLCFLASLPMGATKEYYDITDKANSMFSEQAAQFPVLESDWKGNTEPNIMLFSRRGQLAGFDMFISNNNYNGYVIAESGSGKSVFLNMIAFNSWIRGDRVFIQDFGGSFQKLCEVVGGQYIEPDKQKPFSLNPFSEIYDQVRLEDELEFLSTFVYSLGANKNRKLYEEQEKLIKSYIQEVIKSIYNQLGNKMEVTDIRDNLNALSRKEEKLRDFCQQLSMYCRGGIYEKFFAGACEVDFSNEFIVAEIQQIESDEDIRDPIIMMLTYHQSNAIYRNNNQGNQRIVNIYDEAHKYIGKDPRMDDFIEQNYRRGRKQQASSIIATQGFDDIYDSASGKLSRAGKAIVNSSSWKFFLKQSETSINLLLKASVFSFGGFDEELMRTTRTVKGEYSEIFLITPEEHKYVYRLVLDRYFYYITTTDGSDKQKIQRKIDQGFTMGEAIEEIIKEEIAAKELR